MDAIEFANKQMCITYVTMLPTTPTVPGALCVSRDYPVGRKYFFKIFANKAWAVSKNGREETCWLIWEKK